MQRVRGRWFPSREGQHLLEQRHTRVELLPGCLPAPHNCHHLRAVISWPMVCSSYLVITLVYGYGGCRFRSNVSKDTIIISASTYGTHGAVRGETDTLSEMRGQYGSGRSPDPILTGSGGRGRAKRGDKPVRVSVIVGKGDGRGFRRRAWRGVIVVDVFEIIGSGNVLVVGGRGSGIGI